MLPIAGSYADLKPREGIQAHPHPSTHANLGRSACLLWPSARLSPERLARLKAHGLCGLCIFLKRVKEMGLRFGVFFT